LVSAKRNESVRERCFAWLELPRHPVFSLSLSAERPISEYSGRKDVTSAGVRNRRIGDRRDQAIRPRCRPSPSGREANRTARWRAGPPAGSQGQQNAQRNLVSVAFSSDASTRADAFVLVAPSGKTYLRPGAAACLACLSTSFELPGRFHESCPQASHDGTRGRVCETWQGVLPNGHHHYPT